MEYEKTMENKKEKISRNILRMESELRFEELSENEILEKIAKYKALSLKLGEEIQNISWKISQADFIYSCEDKKQNNYLRKIERSDVMVRKSEVPNRLNGHAELENLSAQLELLRRTNTDKRESISCTEKELVSLKKRNEATLQELMNELEELENEERKLEDMLEQIRENYDIC